MTWFENIYDLQYYHQPKGVPCFCEAVTYPHDLQLQGALSDSVNNYSIKFYVYSADGTTQYEDATIYFDYYFGVLNNPKHHFFSARLKSYAPSMCAHACYIIRVVVTGSLGGQTLTMFDKYTERYCQNDCCDVPQNISITQTGFSPLVVGGEGHLVNSVDTVFTSDNPTGTAVPGTFAPVSPVAPTGDCGEPLIRLITSFDCLDNFTGDFYGMPDSTLSGTTANFQYTKVSTFKGRLVRRPREIAREISYNCRLQSSESTHVYVLEGFELFPAWKMAEIENQLHAKYIYVDDYKKGKRYEYAGDTPFAQVSNCFELFKLSTTLQDCTQRQIYNCAPACKTQTNPDGSNMLFAIPQGYQGGAFFNEQKIKIAHDYDGLLDYLRTRDGVEAVNEINTTSLDCTVSNIVTITTSKPQFTSIYFDEPYNSNLVSAQVVNDFNEVCAQQPAYCIRPVADGFTIIENICAAPVSSGITMEEIEPEMVGVVGYNDWLEEDAYTYASVINKQVTLNLKVTSDQYTEDPEFAGESIAIPSEIIGVIGSSGRPGLIVSLHSGNSNLPEDVYLTIDEYGLIRYSGLVTTATAEEVTININNLIYNI